jgi:23S rRNA (guanine745-N1)-methyltransferase
MTATGQSALDLVLPVLRCPVCGEELSRGDGALVCPARHTFDIARQGYVSLLGGEVARSGDDAAMVRARERFLTTGKYDPIRDAIATLAAAMDPPPTTVLDAGCGTGYYLTGILDALPGAHGIGLDSSPRALRLAARAHPRAAAATWDVFRPFPIASGSVDLILDVFAPRNPAEFHRVLRPTGRLIVARPDSGHLAQLRDRVEGMIEVDPAKEDRLHAALDPDFETGDTVRVDYPISLTSTEVTDLIGMTPSARHIDELEAETGAEHAGQVDVSVLAGVYLPR